MKRALPPLIALFVGAITLAFTIGLCVHERDNEQARLRAVFDANARQTAGRIEQRIANYEQMLRGVQGLLSANNGVDPRGLRDLRRHGDGRPGRRRPAERGVRAAGDAGRAARARRQRMRLAGHPDYRLRPDGARDAYAPIALVAPDSVANRMVLGYDSLSEATRHAAMVQARDSGNATLTALVQLRVDSGPELRPGCLIYLPVYA